MLPIGRRLLPVVSPSCHDIRTGPRSGRSHSAACGDGCSVRAGSASGGRRSGIFGTTRIRRFSTASTVLPGAIPVRLATRKIWVSTAIVGWPKAVFRTTLAVLCPTLATPRKCWSAGTSLRRDRGCAGLQVLMMFFALDCCKGHGPDIRLQPFDPSAWMACAVFATGTNRAVALLTPFVGGLGRQG